jgi:hypothetical protein
VGAGVFGSHCATRQFLARRESVDQLNLFRVVLFK